MVEPVESHELNGRVVFSSFHDRIAEAGATEQEQPGGFGSGVAANQEQIADVLQFLEVAVGDGFLPLSLADG